MLLDEWAPARHFLQKKRQEIKSLDCLHLDLLLLVIAQVNVPPFAGMLALAHSLAGALHLTVSVKSAE
jgi:hypothetical protein